jgi:hypothetical protein
LLDRLRKLNWLQRQRQLACLNARDIEDFVNQTK